jgi:hypothetical protein
MMHQFNERKMDEGNIFMYSILLQERLSKYKVVIYHGNCKVAVAQRMISSEWCLRSYRFGPTCADIVFFSCSISPENSGSVKN